MKLSSSQGKPSTGSWGNGGLEFWQKRGERAGLQMGGVVGVLHPPLPLCWSGVSRPRDGENPRSLSEGAAPEPGPARLLRR